MISPVLHTPPIQNQRILTARTIEPKIKCNNVSCQFHENGFCRFKDAELKWADDNKMICTKYKRKRGI
jgi:hypothetical protein